MYGAPVQAMVGHNPANKTFTHRKHSQVPQNMLKGIKNSINSHSAQGKG